MTNPARHWWLGAAWALGVAALGGALTTLDAWYAGLQQPPWKPADAWFGPVWTTIFALCVVAGVHAWRGAPNVAARQRVLRAYAMNSVANVAWSALFFYAQRPDWALAEVGVLWASVLHLWWVTRQNHRRAAWCLVPYWLWVSFAAALNAAVVNANAPFA